jgi:hypothetical protein
VSVAAAERDSQDSARLDQTLTAIDREIHQHATARGRAVIERDLRMPAIARALAVVRTELATAGEADSETESMNRPL